MSWLDTAERNVPPGGALRTAGRSQKASVSPAALARARAVLGRALVDGGRELSRGILLVKQAVTLLQKSEGELSTEVAELKAWSARYGGNAYIAH